MAFRLIKNRAQEIAVKGALATAGVCVVAAIFKPWLAEVIAPLLMVWAMIWLIGQSSNSKSDS